MNAQRRPFIFYSDTFELPLPEGHKFPMSKYRLLRERLEQKGFAKKKWMRAPRAALDSELLLVHTADYLSAVKEGRLEKLMQKRIGFPWSEAMVERSRRSVGASLEAMMAAISSQVSGTGLGINLAGGTHHAFSDRGEGFCVFNDFSVAAAHYLKERPNEQIAIIDCDVHQGNGTAKIFEEEPRVWTFSMHGSDNYPYRKMVSDLDIALPAGTGDDAYLMALHQGLTETAKKTSPALVLYVSGADPYFKDRFGSLGLSKEGLQARDEAVCLWAQEQSASLVISMGGGYAPNIEDIVDIHEATVSTALQCFRIESLDIG